MLYAAEEDYDDAMQYAVSAFVHISRHTRLASQLHFNLLFFEELDIFQVKNATLGIL